MKKSDIIGLVLLAFVIGCRFIMPLADFYAERCYPYISAVLSLIASIVPFSLEEVVIIGLAAVLIFILVRAIRRKEGFLGWLAKTARLAMWIVVWFYMGWGNNYFRTPLIPRIGIPRVSYEEEAFSSFLEDYTEELNETATASLSLDRKKLEADIKDFYSEVVSCFGYTPLRSWQHTKKTLLNPLYSADGVTGFMGPFLCEAQLNRDIPDVEYPFTMAHELAHLAGVTSEAEANYWAYAYCRLSEDPAVRYSGHLGLLHYVSSSVDYFLPEEKGKEWAHTISDKVLEDYFFLFDYWGEKRVDLFDDVQYWIMDLFLKSNGVSVGAKDYYGVIGILMTMDHSFDFSRKEY